MVINLKDNSEKDKYILELFRTSPKEAFRLLFDAYHMKLCIYAVQLTDSFEMAEDIVQDFFIYFWEKKYYLKINQNLRYYLYLSVRNAAINTFLKNSTLVMILKILGVGYVNSVKVMMVLFGLVLKIRDYFIFIRKVERLKNSHILLFIKMFMVYVWTVMICG